MNFENNELAIEQIDTTKQIRRNSPELVEAVLELQEKINEIIEVINVLTLPDDEEAMMDEEDEDGDVIIGKPVLKNPK